MKTLNPSAKFKLNKTVVTRFAAVNTRDNQMSSSIFTSSVMMVSGGHAAQGCPVVKVLARN